jgi:hypothetical protein
MKPQKGFSLVELLVVVAIREASPSIKSGDSQWTKDVHNLDSFLNGAAAYHDLGFGLANFKNPFKNQKTKQVYSLSNLNDAMDAKLMSKGNIILKVNPNFPTDGSKINGDRQFQVIYYKEDGVIDTPQVTSYILK